MNLLEKLQQDMRAAMKAGQKDRLSVLRMLISDVKNIDLAPKKTTAEEAVSAYAKKLRKSAEEYERLGKPDEAARLKQEAAIAEEYLPKKAGPDQTQRLVEQFLAANSFTEKQVGPAIGAFMKAHGAEVDAGVASAAIRAKLAPKPA